MKGACCAGCVCKQVVHEPLRHSSLLALAAPPNLLPTLPCVLFHRPPPALSPVVLCPFFAPPPPPVILTQPPKAPQAVQQTPAVRPPAAATKGTAIRHRSSSSSIWWWCGRWQQQQGQEERRQQQASQQDECRGAWESHGRCRGVGLTVSGWGCVTFSVRVGVRKCVGVDV